MTRAGAQRYLDRLRAAVTRFDEASAQQVLDELSQTLPLSEAVCEVLMPFLQDIGDRWEAGTISVAHEHFASQLVRRRLSATTTTWGNGTGPTAVLACVPRERHDIPLLCFGALMAEAGWRVRFLGDDAPVAALALACHAMNPDLVVVSATRRRAFEACESSLRGLSGKHQLALGGRGADAELAASLNAALLPDDLVEATRQAAALVASSST